MPTKEILFGEESRKSIKIGVDKVANVVKTTLGAKGRNVIIGRKMSSQITKDGVTVAKSIQLEDPIEVIGADLIKKVAKKTVDQAGDGTTTSTILAQAIIYEGFKLIAAGHNPIELKKGIDNAVDAVVNGIVSMSEKVEIDSDRLNQIATVSSNNDKEIGNLVADAFKQTGKDGVITIENSQTGQTYIKVVDGMQFDRGMISPWFVINEEKLSAEFENALILVSADKISTEKEFVPFLQKAVATRKPILIIAEDITDYALSSSIINRIKGAYPICAVKAPSYGADKYEILRDICAMTGATLVDESAGIRMDTVELKHLGNAEKVTITRDSTTIVNGGGKKEDIEGRVKYIRTALGLSSNDFEKEQLQNRLAKINGGVAVIYVGAATDIELSEKKDRVEDAMKATKCAIEEGIVVGGGVALIRCIDKLFELKYNTDDERVGIKLVQKILSSPFKQMIENAGVDISIKEIENKNVNYGYNFKTDTFEDLVESGIIDPAKVVRVSLVNAASLAGTLLTSDALIVQSDDVPNFPMPPQ